MLQIVHSCANQHRQQLYLWQCVVQLSGEQQCVRALRNIGSVHNIVIRIIKIAVFHRNEVVLQAAAQTCRRMKEELLEECIISGVSKTRQSLILWFSLSLRVCVRVKLFYPSSTTHSYKTSADETKHLSRKTTDRECMGSNDHINEDHMSKIPFEIQRQTRKHIELRSSQRGGG